MKSVHLLGCGLKDRLSILGMHKQFCLCYYGVPDDCGAKYDWKKMYSGRGGGGFLAVDIDAKSLFAHHLRKPRLRMRTAIPGLRHMPSWLGT